MKRDLPENYRPSPQDADWFIEHWNRLPNYSNQEKALDKLFTLLCPYNENIEDVLLKCATLNDFYSTHVLDIYALARRIHSLHIDARLRQGDLSLVNDISKLEIGGKTHFFYSFATKYCSHHYPLIYPIYDNYVEKVLLAMQKRDVFSKSKFKASDLKNYEFYRSVILDFQSFYGLKQYDIKQVDKYLWQLGKWYFNPFGVVFKYYHREEHSPFSDEDVRNYFWYGEKMYVTNNISITEWEKNGRELLRTADQSLVELALRYTPEQFGLIVYIETLFKKWAPEDDCSWIFQY